MFLLDFLDQSFFLLETAPTPQQQPSLWEGLSGMLPILILFIVIMYLFIIRPQRKQEDEKRRLLDSLKKNDRVVTVGGLHGTIHTIKSDTVLLTVADDVQLKFNKSAVQAVVKRADSPDEETPEPEKDGKKE